jgi:hypothetical protein
MDEPSSLTYPANPSSRSIALRELDAHPVAGNQPYEVGAKTVGDVSEDPDPVLQLDPVQPIGKRLEHPTIDELGRPGHERRLYLNTGTRKLGAFANAPMIRRSLVVCQVPV